MTEFSKRQQVLLDRLITLGQWSTEGRLPVRVLEVYGFGSFFRGKDRPRDVDLLFRRAKEDTNEFRLFSKLLDQVCAVPSSSKEVSTPQAALLQAFDEHYSDLIPGLIDIREQRALFGWWMEGYTWKMFSTSDMIRRLALRNPMEIAKRLVKRNLPNLNVCWWIGPEEPADRSGLRAGFVVLLWAEEKPDVRANIEAALRDDRRRGSILEDLTRFDGDLFRIETQIDLMKKGFGRLLRTPRSRKRAKEHFEWLRAWVKRQKGICADALEKAMLYDDLMSQEEIVKTLGLTYPSPSYDGMSVDQLGELVEKKRSRLRLLHHYLDVVREAIGLLAGYKSGWSVKVRSPKDFLVTQFLYNKTPTWWKKANPVLADLGLDISRRTIDQFYEGSE